MTNQIVAPIINQIEPNKIIDDRVQKIQENKAKISELADKYAATNIRFFSLTTEEGGISDTEVNFLINLPEKGSLLEQGGLLMELRELLQFQLYVFTEDGLKERYHNLILAKAITL